MKKTLEGLLAEANGKRRVRTFDLAEVVHCVREARELGHGCSVGGTVCNSYGYTAYATVCLAVQRKDGKIMVGIAQAYTGTSCTPGRVWKDLQPYGVGSAFPTRPATWAEKRAANKLVVA